MQQFPILLDGREIGTACLDGARCTARCRVPEDGLYRAYLRGAQGEALIGVLEPRAGAAYAERRLTEAERAALGTIAEAYAARSFAFAPEDWQPLPPGAFFRDEALNRALAQIPGAQTCREGGGRLLALPFDPCRPFPLQELFCFARIRRVGGGLCAVYRVDGQGRPIF